MPFTILHHTENELQQIILSDEETRCSVSVLPSCGAMLHSFNLQSSVDSFNIIDSYKSLSEFKNTVYASHKSSKLSPFVCRIKEGKYGFDNKKYEFMNKFQDGSAIHGLLVKKSFEVTNESATVNAASVTMKYDYQKDDSAYPFDYSCEVKYELKKNRTLTIETTVTNTGKQSIPIADGWHPYFTLGAKIDDCELSFHAKQMLEFDGELIPTGRLIPNTRFNGPEKIGNTFLDNCFLLNEVNGGAACSLRNPANGWELLFFPDKHYRYLQVYTPPHRNNIAIENLSAAPDCFNNGIGLILLEPAQSRTFTVSYQILIP
ncbi:MAG: aldose 1-epimerase [Bacteroidetes bacterium]|nr:aldose 1-epimerase [Bacteroidota bacterium]